MDPEQLAERVWPGQQLVIEPLGGGITNRNFKVDADGREFVLRIGGKDTELLGIDRSAEYAASSVAAGSRFAFEDSYATSPDAWKIIPGVLRAS